MAIIDVSQAERCGFLIKQGCPVAPEDITLFTEQDILDLIGTNPSNVNLTYTNTPFSFNQLTQSGNIPISAQLSYNPTTKILTWLRGNGDPTVTYDLSSTADDIKITTVLTINSLIYPVGTSLTTILSALTSVSAINNITTSSTVNARYDTLLPLTGVVFPVAPITKDIHIATFKNGIATYVYNAPTWSLVSFLAKDEIEYGTTTVISTGLILRFVIPIPSSINGTIPRHTTVNVKNGGGGENWDFLDYSTSEIGVNYYVAPAIGNITYNWSITK